MAHETLKQAGQSLSEAEAEATDALGEYQGEPPVRALSAIGKLGDQPELRLLSGGVIAAGLLLGRKRLIRAGARMLLAHELATAIKDFVKRRIDRTRPRAARDRTQAKARPGRRTAKEHTSFPSGHSAGSVAVAQAFAREFPELRAPALAAAGLVAVAQVPKRAHYPTDVAAGVMVGAVAEALLAKAWPVESGDKAPQVSRVKSPGRRQ